VVVVVAVVVVVVVVAAGATKVVHISATILNVHFPQYPNLNELSLIYMNTLLFEGTIIALL
jgi:hypothetical protein